MGSGFYSFEEAASRLGRSKRSLHDYVKKGFLKKRIENGVSVLVREDVDLMAVDIGVDSPAMNRKTFFQMQTSIQHLKDEMRAVKHALELRDIQPLRPDPNMSLGLFSAAQTYLHIQNRPDVWTPEFVEKWSDIFERTDEETLSSLVKATNDPQAWVVFFRFCSEMMDFCWEKDRTMPSLVWQARATRLDAARRTLRGVVVTWVEMGKGVVPQQFLEALGSSREALLSRVAKG